MKTRNHFLLLSGLASGGEVFSTCGGDCGVCFAESVVLAVLRREAGQLFRGRNLLAFIAFDLSLIFFYE